MIDHKYQIHSNWKFLKHTPRRCPGFEPPAHKGDWMVMIGCIAMLGLYVWFAR